MSEEKHYITKEGLEKAKQELRFLKIEKRREVAQKIAQAKELGDLSENAEYQEAKDELAFIEGRIMQLEDLVARAQVIEENESGNAAKAVSIGGTVTAKIDKREVVYKIVGSNEADPAAGRISNESPLGRAFLGKAIGDDVEVKTPAGVVIYKIVEIK